MEITPIKQCVLVKLTNSYEFVATPDKKYDSKTSGIVVKISEDIENPQYAVGDKVFFEEYKDSTSFENDDGKQALIEDKDIRGVQKNG